MTKSLIVEQSKVLAKSEIHTSNIPVNTYDRTLEQEQSIFSTEDFLHIWRDMCAIREFETILNEIKTKGYYKGTTYNDAGPARLSIGQGAAAVGMAFAPMQFRVCKGNYASRLRPWRQRFRYCPYLVERPFGRGIRRPATLPEAYLSD